MHFSLFNIRVFEMEQYKGIVKTRTPERSMTVKGNYKVREPIIPPLFPYQVLIPVVIFAVLMISLNLFADGLRDALDPKMKQK